MAESMLLGPSAAPGGACGHVAELVVILEAEMGSRTPLAGTSTSCMATEPLLLEVRDSNEALSYAPPQLSRPRRLYLSCLSYHHQGCGWRELLAHC